MFSYALSSRTCSILRTLYQCSSSLRYCQIVFSRGAFSQRLKAFTTATIRRQCMLIIPRHHDCSQPSSKRYYGTLLGWPDSTHSLLFSLPAVLLGIVTGYVIYREPRKAIHLGLLQKLPLLHTYCWTTSVKVAVSTFIRYMRKISAYSQC